MLNISKKLFTPLLLLVLSITAVSTVTYPANFNNELDKLESNKTDQLMTTVDYRLPKSLVPQTYDIQLDVDKSGTNFTGRVTIVAIVEEETNKIAFHSGNKLTSEPVSIIKGNKKIEYTDVSKDNVTEIQTILLKEKLNKSDRISIIIDFEGSLRDDMIGFYRSTYIDENNEEIWLAATQFEATSARHAFPCFDEPAFKATFKISISKKNLPEGYDCLSNMPLYPTSNNETCIFVESVPMSTYLVAFVISNFKNKTISTAKNPLIQVWTHQEFLDQSNYANEIALKSLEVFTKDLDNSYKLDKMDLVAVPDFSAGAMENWGLITFRDTNLLYDENHTSNAMKQKVASTIIHEIAHMWFGNLVTAKWWGYLWLNEGFARYFQYMTTAKVENSWKMEQQFVVEQHQSALAVDSLEDSKPMTREAKTTADIGGTGDKITYNKGASILRMVEQTFGSDIFKSALQDYLKHNEFSSSTPEDLWEAFQKYLDKSGDPSKHINITAYLKSWTDEPGFPYIKVDIKKDSIALSQERFLLRNFSEVNTSTTWSVPITWISSSSQNLSTKPVFWLTKKQDEIPYKNDGAKWLILNVQSSGFYRVLYDNATWRNIIEELKNGDFEKIPVLNRAAIVDDLLNLARAGKIGYDIALSGLQYLKRETNYLPFKSAFTALEYLTRKFASIGTDYNVFKEYVTSLYSNIYKKIGFDDKKEDDQMTILLRQEINNNACNFDHPNCIAMSQKYFSGWKKNQIESIPKNQRTAVYCAAIKYGTSEDWKFLWEKYMKSNVASEQIIILSALGCTKDKKKLEEHLLKSLNPNYYESRIRKQDISLVFSAVYSASLQNAEYILDFIEKHHEAIYKYHKNYDEIASLVSGVLQKYPTKDLIARVKKMLEKNPTHIKNIKKSLEKSVHLANFELNWFKKHSSTISKYIKNSEENTEMYRLPHDVVPDSYKIQLTPNFKSFSFDGKVQITAKIVKETDKIVLHADQLDIEDEDITVSSYKIKKIDYTEKYHFKTIQLSSTLKVNTTIQISIIYRGYLNTEMRGFYRSSYKKEGVSRWLAATHLEPVGARRVFPCFDEPSLKATFDITVIAPSGYNVISNTDLTEKGKLEAKNGQWEFKTTPKMSTYLVAIVVSDFVSQEQIDDKCRYVVWSNPLVTHQLNYSLEVMKPIVEEFERRLKIPYGRGNLNKLEMVALPDFSSGAMENWGLITFRETNMLYDSLVMSSLAAKQSIRNVIAHEIAHQWFGNLVSPFWWDYLWLSEGFARYFQYFVFTEDENSWDLETQFVVDHLQTSFATDASPNTHPITDKVYSPTEIRGIFDTISYAKAGSVIRMLEKLIGWDLFYNALNDYLKKCEYESGTPELLFSSFENITNFNVSEFMNNWTTQAGFPVVNINITGNTAKLTQKRFYLKPTEKNNTSTWIIPISWTTGANPNFLETSTVQWLKNEQMEIQIENSDKDWVIFNIQQTGYYRVNYDESSWRRIFAILNSANYKRVHTLNRAALVDDLLNLGRSELLSYDIVLEGLKYLRRETEYAPWKAAHSGFAYLTRRFAGHPVIYKAYRTYLFELLEPVYNSLKFDDVKGEKHTYQLLRKLILEWLCSLEHETCTSEAIKRFNREREESSFSVSPNQQAVVYCTAIRHGKEDAWNYLMKKFKKSDYATEKITILTALGCSQNQIHLKTILNETIRNNSEVRLQDAQKVFTNVISGSLVGIETTLEFIKENHKAMKEYFKDNSVTKSIISTLSKRLSTDKLNEKFESFINFAKENMPDITKSLQTSLDNARYELEWYNKKTVHILQSLDRLVKNIPNYRLPMIAKPISYQIYLIPYLEEGNFTFDGNTTIKINVIDDTFEITLNVDKLDIKKITLANNKVVNTSLNEESQQLTIYFKKPLKPNTEININFVFTGELRNDMRGFYRSSYVNEKNETRWIASTQFEPTYARSAFPCFDEPAFKASFTINIAKPEGYHTLSNMGSKRTQISHENKKWDKYEPSLKMSSYLVAFVVSDFVETKSPNSSVSVWSRKALSGYCSYASHVGDEVLKILGNKLKYKYVHDEMNFVSVPDFDMGAMENWGLVTFREYGLSYDIHEISASYRRYVNTVVSHELVHQWFGNLVTLEWWDYTWLNEGFAEYLSYLISNEIEEKWDLLKQFVVNELHVALNVDSSVSSHAMNNKVLTPKDVQGGFDKIAYQKSGSVLRMFQHSFGDTAFFTALSNYIAKNHYDNIRPEHLVEQFQKYFDSFEGKIPGEPSVNITNIMNSWITQPGYPVVKAERDDFDYIHLNQERFLISSDNITEKKRVYWIPITYTTESEKNFDNTNPHLWLDGEEKRFVIQPNDTWFIINVQEIGFYRVNYDERNWKKLVDVLNSENYTNIDELNRAQLIDDSLNLARADYLDYDIALNITMHLSKEKNYFSWKAFFSATSYLNQRIEGQPKLKNLYTQHVLSLLSSAYQHFGFKENTTTDTHLEQLTRELILTNACKYEHEHCISEAKTYFKQADSITPNIASAVYCTAIKYGSSSDWDALWNKFEKVDLASDYITILKGLGCSKDPVVLEKYMSFAFATNSKIRRQDLATALSSIYTSSQVGLQTAIHFFQKNTKQIYDYYGNWDDVGSLFTSIGGLISTRDQIENLKKLEKDEKLSEIKSFIKAAVNTAQKNLDWLEKHLEKIQKWFDDRYKVDFGSTGKPNSAVTSTLQITVIFASLCSYFIFF